MGEPKTVQLLSNIHICRSIRIKEFQSERDRKAVTESNTHRERGGEEREGERERETDRDRQLEREKQRERDRQTYWGRERE